MGFITSQIKYAVRRLLAEEPPKSSTAHAQPVTQAPATTSLGEAPVTISISQLDELRGQVRDAQLRVQRLTEELAEAKTGSTDSRVAGLARLAQNCLVVVRFAVANLPPSEIPKWPWLVVTAIAADLSWLPTFGADDEVFRTELNLFVADIKEHELDRSRKMQKLIDDAPDHMPPRRKLGGSNPG